MLSLRRWQDRNAIDLGGGHLVRPEDLLEGHFQRLSAQRRAGPTRDVRVQVTPNFNAAIRVTAPAIAPLTEIAEEVAAKIDTVQPAPQFRQDLQRALQAAHEQHMQQRALGIYPPPSAPKTARWIWLIAAGAATLGIAGALLWLLAPRRAQA
jgi:hypothetical protein